MYYPFVFYTVISLFTGVSEEDSQKLEELAQKLNLDLEAEENNSEDEDAESTTSNASSSSKLSAV